MHILIFVIYFVVMIFSVYLGLDVILICALYFSRHLRFLEALACI